MTPVSDEPVSYEAISAMVYTCRERQKASGEGDQMLSRWISEGLAQLALRSQSPEHSSSEPVAFTGLPARKLEDLKERGWQVVGYALQNGEQRYGFITTGGFVGWWLPGDYPLHTTEPTVSQPASEPVRVKPRSDNQFQIVGEAFLNGIGAPNKSRDNDLAIAKATLSPTESQPLTGEEVERLLWASVPEPYKSATSPVGAVQGYIADLEARLSAVEGTGVERIMDWLCDDVLPSYGIDGSIARNDPEAAESCREALTTITGGENER